MEFEVGYHLFLRVTPTIRVEIRSRKLSPNFLGSYEILRRNEPVAYEMTLPPQLSNLHNVVLLVVL